MKITNKEYNQIIHELAEEFKDIVFLKGEELLKKLITKEFIENDLEKEDTVKIQYRFGFSKADVWQILGRIRRKTKKK